VVNELLGNGSVETTRAYLHVDDTALRGAAGQVNTCLGSQP
jgi:site-specific recombinase XerD